MASLRALRLLPAWPSVVLVLLAVQSCAASMAAWYTTLGPQLIRQNDTSGKIMYSMCNSNDTPIFPVEPSILTLQYTPRNGTAMGGRGWWDEKTTYASIFYQNKDGAIVNTFHSCDFRTGKFNRKSDVVISTGFPRPHPETGLGVVNMGAKDGYRIFYHDANKTQHVIGYNPSDNSWYYGGFVSKDIPLGMAIGATEREGNGNITVIVPRDGENIGIARLNTIKKWMLSSTPRPLIGNFTANTNVTNSTDIKLDMQSELNFTLAGWTGNPATLAISTDKVFTRNIFWIGSDRALHQIANKNYVWQTTGLNLTRNVWPLADEPNGDFAMAWHLDTSRIRIYYDVNGNLTELRQEESGLWQPARSVLTYNATVISSPTTNPTDTTTTETATNTPDAAAANAGGPSNELSTGAKAGIGVGVAFGVLGIGGALFGVWLMKRRQAAAAAEEEEVREEEKHRQAAIAAASSGGGSSQQYYYGGSGPNTDGSGGHYPAPYGSPPPPLTPFSDQGSSNGGHWPPEKVPEAAGPPQELHNRSAAYELPEQRQTLEMEGWQQQQQQQQLQQQQQQQLQQQQQQQQHQI